MSHATFTMMAALVGGAALVAWVGLTVVETVEAESCRLAGAQLGVQVAWRTGAMGEDGACYQLSAAAGWVPLPETGR